MGGPQANRTPAAKPFGNVRTCRASSREPFRIGLRHDDATLDEVVCSLPSVVHLEQMDDDAWWLGIDLTDGRRITVNLTTGGPRRGARITGTCYVEGSARAVPVERIDVRAVEASRARRRRS